MIDYFLAAQLLNEYTAVLVKPVHIKKVLLARPELRRAIEKRGVTPQLGDELIVGIAQVIFGMNDVDHLDPNVTYTPEFSARVKRAADQHDVVCGFSWDADDDLMTEPEQHPPPPGDRIQFFERLDGQE